MTAPAYLSSSYRYFEKWGVTSVATIISDFATEVLADNPAWTDLGGGLYKSPVDADGRFFDVLLTDEDGTNHVKMSARIRDQNGTTLCTRRINLPASPSCYVRIYTGQYHFAIDVDPVSTACEFLMGGILDLTPEGQTAHGHYCYGHGSRTTADVKGSDTMAM